MPWKRWVKSDGDNGIFIAYRQDKSARPSFSIVATAYTLSDILFMFIPIVAWI